MIADKDDIVCSLKSSICELDATICNAIKEHKDDSRVYMTLGTALFWIGACLDRLCANGETENEYERAFRGAYNIQKHSIQLCKFQRYDCGGVSFPITFPLAIAAPDYCFAKMEHAVIENERYVKAYNKTLSGKPIMPEIKKIQQVILCKLDRH